MRKNSKNTHGDSNNNVFGNYFRDQYQSQGIAVDQNNMYAGMVLQNQGQQPNSNVDQALQSAKADFLAIKDAYEELKAASSPVSAHPDPNTTKPPAIPETIQQILGKLLSALRRSKVLFMSIS